LQARGQATWIDPARDKPLVRDTVHCAHCEALHFVTPGVVPTDEGGWCMRCGDYICGPCADKGRCTPWERQMERAEARGALLRQVERLART
jgi:hypothetical protein